MQTLPGAFPQPLALQQTCISDALATDRQQQAQSEKTEKLVCSQQHNDLHLSQISAPNRHSFGKLPLEVLALIFEYVRDTPPTVKMQSKDPTDATDSAGAKTSLDLFAALSASAPVPGQASLFRCALVCKSFYAAVVPILWYSPYLPTLSIFAEFLRALRFSASHRSRPCQNSTQTSLSRKDSRCHDMECTTSLIGHIGARFFRRWDVSTTPHLSDMITHELLAAVVDAGPPHLSHLSLKACRNLEDAAVVHTTLAISSTLVSLDLSGCFRITDVSLMMLTDACAANGRLRSLRLGRDALVTDVGIEFLGRCLAGSLTRLDLSGCTTISGRAVERLLKRLRRPQTALNPIDSTGNFPKPRSELLSISDGSMQEQDASDSSTGILQELRIHFCENITRNELIRIATELQRSHRRLKVLEFSVPAAPEGTQRPFNIFNAFPVESLCGLEALQELHIHRASLIPENIIMRIIEVCGPRLIKLTLTEMSDENQVTFPHIIATCKNLTHLSLARSTSVSHNAIAILLASRCMSTLVSLDLSGCFNLSDETLCMLAMGHKKLPCSLSRLSLAYCHGITLNGIKILVRGLCPPSGALTWIDITGTLDVYQLQHLEQQLDYAWELLSLKLGLDQQSERHAIQPLPNRVAETAAFEMLPPKVGAGYKNASFSHVLSGTRLAAFVYHLHAIH